MEQVESISCTHHHHHHAPDIDADNTGFRLLVTLILNLAIPIVQIVGGVVAHSFALISDATHNFSDFAAILISYIAFRIGKKGPSLQNTFGYRRAEILAAMINVALLVGASIVILMGAFGRLMRPEPIEGGLVMVIAGVGVLGNGFSAWLLHQGSRQNVNVRGAFLHMMGDMLTSVMVVVNGFILLYRPWYWIDPLLSVLIVGFILKNCWGILKASTGILMNATPVHIDIRDVLEYLEGVSGVQGAHYLHAWSLGSSGVAFSAHIVVPDQPVSGLEALRQRISDDLFSRFGIDHPVLQFETESCGNGGMFCEQLCASPGSESHSYGGRQPAVGSGQPAVGSGQYSKAKNYIPSHDYGPADFPSPGRSLDCMGDSHENLDLSHDESGSHERGSFFNFPPWQWVFLVCRIGLGIVWIWASFDKIRHPQAFAEIVYNYQILPDQLVNITALVLPWFELVIGVFLAIGKWVPGAAFGSSLLMSVFLAALGYNLARGLDIHCGCFSTSATEGPISWWEMVRDGFLWLVSVGLFVREHFNRGPCRS